MRLGVLFSGGKDSSYAMFKEMEKNLVVCLISIISKNKESYMFHTPNIEITKLQAEAIGLPLIQKETEGRKEEELRDLEVAIKEAKEKFKIEGVITGAVESVYQSDRIKKICDRLNLRCVNPLWKGNQVELLNEIVKNKFKVIISGVFAYPLDETWLGRELNENTVNELVNFSKKYHISPLGEGGELETTVLDTPFFKKRIEILESEVKFKDNSGVFLIKKARLVEK
jgi:ABC transporter with metal-binding/Fe-S-binding domain ATP-binding protein